MNEKAEYIISKKFFNYKEEWVKYNMEDIFERILNLYIKEVTLLKSTRRFNSEEEIANLAIKNVNKIFDSILKKF